MNTKRHSRHNPEDCQELQETPDQAEFRKLQLMEDVFTDLNALSRHLTFADDEELMPSLQTKQKFNPPMATVNSARVKEPTFDEVLENHNLKTIREEVSYVQFQA